MLHLTVILSDRRLLWLRERDTCGSDHVPIRLTQPCTHSRFGYNRRLVIWNRLREILSDTHYESYLIESIVSTLHKVTLKTTTPLRSSVPNIKCVNLRAAHRRA